MKLAITEVASVQKYVYANMLVCEDAKDIYNAVRIRLWNIYAKETHNLYWIFRPWFFLPKDVVLEILALLL